MGTWKLTILALAVAASGCRHPVSLHGHSLACELEPMYKQPAGYSSTYHRHLRQSSVAVEYLPVQAEPLEPQPLVPVPDQTPDATKPDDRVIIPAPCGPVCEQPKGGSRR